jgi:hypothetical protein
MRCSHCGDTESPLFEVDQDELLCSDCVQALEQEIDMD